MARPQGLPLEEQLLQSTLWPERLKLYGHPNEIVCVAANARHLASACKAQAAAMADVIVWDIATCRSAPLPCPRASGCGGIGCHRATEPGHCMILARPEVDLVVISSPHPQGSKIFWDFGLRNDSPPFYSVCSVLHLEHHKQEGDGTMQCDKCDAVCTLPPNAPSPCPGNSLLSPATH